MMQSRRSKRAALAGAFAALALAAPVPAFSSPQETGLTIRPITWNVIGLDSNDVDAGPNGFPVGARVCNTSASTVTNVTSNFAFDSANANITAVGPDRLSLGDLAAGDCVDAHYNVAVTRTEDAYDTTRQYHVSVSADGVDPVSTPAGRELYVEHLISQSRNGIQTITGTGIDVAPSDEASGHASLVVGETYTFTVVSDTAPGGYEQLESFLTLPNTIFQILTVDVTYDEPEAATNDTIYADACGWDNDLGSDDYRSCSGPEQFDGGKAGGDPITTTYTVKVIQAGTGTLGTVIYDFSGSSFHYNRDYGSNETTVEFLAEEPEADGDDPIIEDDGDDPIIEDDGDDPIIEDEDDPIIENEDDPIVEGENIDRPGEDDEIEVPVTGSEDNDPVIADVAADGAGNGPAAAAPEGPEVAAVSAAPQELPRTGGNLLLEGLVALALLGIGGALLLGKRMVGLND